MDEKVYYIWLSLALGTDSRAASTVFSRFSSAKEVYDEDDYGGMKLADSQRKRLADKSLDKAISIYSDCKAKNVGILTYHDALFPSKLRIISSPPVVLYYRGKLKNLDDEYLAAIVGTRNVSDYGRKTTRWFASSLTKSGAVIVSGMASGVDGEAQRTCAANGGYTVAVLGTAIDRPYPRENIDLYDKIVQTGLVVSEYYPSCTTYASCFPSRNRIISGLSSSVIVTEAGAASGALITAKTAVMQGREVYALPGLAGSENSSGTNMLLQKGVNLAYRPLDVLAKAELVFPSKIHAAETTLDDVSPVYKKAEKAEVIPPKDEKPKEKPKDEKPEKKTKLRKSEDSRLFAPEIGELEPDEVKVVTAIGENALYIDEIIALTGLEASDAMSTATILELCGVIAQDEKGRYRVK